MIRELPARIAAIPYRAVRSLMRFELSSSQDVPDEISVFAPIAFVAAVVQWAKRGRSSPDRTAAFNELLDHDISWREAQALAEARRLHEKEAERRRLESDRRFSN